MNERIFLSPPDAGSDERNAILDAFDQGWLAPVGPQLDEFEQRLVDYTKGAACVALSSGTAALHLALICAGVQPGDEVVVQSATFAASAFAVCHAGAVPVFIDSELSSWCMDPVLLGDFLARRAQAGALPKAVMPVDLYGSTANYALIKSMCDEYDVSLVRDAAEALGSTSSTGAVGEALIPAALSFNGNKIITTSSGGALVADPETVDRARYLATQARQPFPYYQHADIGFNYRMSNLLASLGSAQLAGLEPKIARRADTQKRYAIEFPEFDWCAFAHTPRPNNWLSVALLPTGIDPLSICDALGEHNIEARHGWKPMHLQPVFDGNEYIAGSGVADDLFARGLCLPSGSAMTDEQLDRVVMALRKTLQSFTNQNV